MFTHVYSKSVLSEYIYPIRALLSACDFLDFKRLCVLSFCGSNTGQGMDADEIHYIGCVWSEYFPKDVFIQHDPRLAGVTMFRDFFLSSMGRSLYSEDQLVTKKHIYFHLAQLCEQLPFNDFEVSLRLRPLEVMGIIGIALSLVARSLHRQCSEAFIIHPRFYGLNDEVAFGDIKSSTVGQMLSVKGHVVRVSPCRPLVESAEFLCAKCMKSTAGRFDDGIFMPPSVCSTPKCNNKFLELDRSTVRTSDYQRVKLTELDEITQQEHSGTSDARVDGGGGAAAAEVARVPRTLEVEVRDTLVNTCVPGDLLSVVGIVRTVQMEAPRSFGSKGGAGGGYKESGLHVLYLLANSLVCLKGSGDRGSSNMHGVRNTTSGAAELISEGPAAGAGPTQSVTLLDERHPQHVNLAPNGPAQFPASSAATNAPTGGSAVGAGCNTPFIAAELSMIRVLALSECAFPLFVHSLCPTIFGHELVKAGLLLGLFGGSSYKNRPQADGANMPQPAGDRSSAGTAEGGAKEFQVRADIHVLVVGDPGLGKSQMLRAAATIAPRAVFVCGNTSTAAGLTVSISRDTSGGGKGGGDLCIEAGALILADQGVCCIDELDKITAEQNALLEAMEQQSISIAKSGVVTSLKSRTAVLAAANPAGGHYNRRKSVCENLKMNAALLSRFDLIFILLDRPDESHDRRIGEHIMQAHGSAGWSGGGGGEPASKRQRDASGAPIAPSLSDADDTELTLAQRLRRNIQSAVHCTDGLGLGHDGVLSVELMRRYIEYAKLYVHPVLSTAAAKVLQRLYLTMRAQASAGQSIPVTTRHLESLIRLAQARARIDLRDEVSAEDAHDVVQLLQESLLDVFTTETGAVDCSRKGGISLSKQVKALVKVMTRESSLRGSSMFSRADIQALCGTLALDKDLDSLIEVMRTECYLLLKGPRLYQLQTA